VTDTVQPAPVVVRVLDRESPAEPGLSALLAAYHLQTEVEKGAAVSDVSALPARYRREIAEPRAAFARDVVLVARSGGVPAGSLVLTAPVAGRSEVKRLWTVPELRGRGVASRLLTVALDHASARDIDTVALSVWKWRTGAIGLYERLGFAVVDSWDDRADLVCMERAV
jgi:putative acetyltransferase